MIASLFSEDNDVILRRAALKKAATIAATGICGVLIAAAINAAIFVPLMIGAHDEAVNALTAALAAGDKAFTYGDHSAPFEIRCTGPGHANAFRLTFDRDGKKVATDDALIKTPWPTNRWFANSVPAARCDSGVN